MENKNIMRILLAVFIILVLAVVLKYTVFNNQQQSPAVETNTNTSVISNFVSSTKQVLLSPTSTATVTSTPATKKTVPKKTVSPTAPVASATPSYVDALDIYRKSGYYVQFYNCQPTPTALTMKSGTKFMIDNRNVTTQKIGLGKTVYTIDGYGFVIAIAPKVSSSTKYNLACNGINSATVLIQP